MLIVSSPLLQYTNISALRQQMQPTHRVHGIIQGKNWAINVIPAECDLFFDVRAPSVGELKELIPRVINCFKAAAIATGCKLKIKEHPLYKDVANNPTLAKSYQSIIQQKYNRTIGDMTFYASTGASFSLECEPIESHYLTCLSMGRFWKRNL
jgi:metal-dependent amidase/aminoacylase/carboxypeptidase family protein